MKVLQTPFPAWQPPLPERVANLRPYSGSEAVGGRRLHANELPWGTPWNRYPQSMPSQLREALGARAGLPGTAVFTANGSDEIIDLLQRTFAEPGADEVLVTSPGFSMYAHAAAVNGLGVCRVPLDKNFLLDEKAALALSSSQTRLAFFCDPNNPTGNRIGEEALFRFMEKFPGIVVLDEAYGEFAGVDHSPWLQQFPNLVLLRTLSKAWGLAGIRLGYAIAHPAIIEAMDRVRMPYSLSEPARRLAMSALEYPQRMTARVARICALRERLAGALRRCDAVQTVYPSEANFLLLQCSDAAGLERAAFAEGLHIRSFRDSPELENCLRITVGTEADNRRLIRVFQQC